MSRRRHAAIGPGSRAGCARDGRARAATCAAPRARAGALAGGGRHRARAYRAPRICGTIARGAGVRVRRAAPREIRTVEASALPAGLTRGRAPLSAAFLRLRSDEQLVAMFRAGSDDAFRAIHDRYRVRLLAYARQMLRGALRRSRGRAAGRVPAGLPGAARERPPGDAARVALSHRAQPLHRRAAPAQARCRASSRPTPSRRSARSRGADEPPEVAERSAALRPARRRRADAARASSARRC